MMVECRYPDERNMDQDACLGRLFAEYRVKVRQRMTNANRLEVIRDLLRLTLQLADAADPMLSAQVCQSLHRVEHLLSRIKR